MLHNFLYWVDMNITVRYCHIICYTALIVLITVFFSGCESRYEDLDLSAYEYRDTKDLIKFVYDASLIVKKDGIRSLQYFKDNRQRYLTPDRYIYIYDTNGVNLYHAGMPHLEGKNLWDLEDKNGKKVSQMVIAAVADNNNPYAWVHYSWWEPGQFYPVPKSSCNFKVITPEGRVVLVGGGLNYPLEEREFVRIIVDDAARLLKRKGASALAEIAHPASKYNFRDVKVFIFTSTGKLLISPVVNDNLADFKLLDCVDEMGHKPFNEALNKLKNGKDSVWQVFLAKNRYERVLIKKSLYLHKSYIEGQEVYVGAITHLPQPPG